MLLFHGSYAAIEEPDLSYSRLRTDFGRGFYLTPLKKQAASWARRFIRQYGMAAISAYEFSSNPEKLTAADMRVLEFSSHNREWLDFVSACRLGLPVDNNWDLIIGGVANDKVFDTLQLYFESLIDADSAIGRLRYSKPSVQYCFKNQRLIDDYLTFSFSEVLR